MAAEQLDFGSQAGDRGAVVSPCGGYRYYLWRTLSSGEAPRRVAFVMLNPSTADALTDDPTIRKCRGFTERWGFDRFDVVNLFAYRATKPITLETAWLNGQNIAGPENERWLARTIGAASLVVFSWGASLPNVGPMHHRIRALLDMAGPTTNRVDSRPGHAGKPVMCLGRTKDGHPRHPSRVAYQTALVPFEVKRDG